SVGLIRRRTDWLCNCSAVVLVCFAGVLVGSAEELIGFATAPSTGWIRNCSAGVLVCSAGVLVGSAEKLIGSAAVLVCSQEYWLDP
ncbi:hypothetical protein FCV25MIE_13651, partial [Fagus crenata]